jgi:hypothetical protein
MEDADSRAHLTKWRWGGHVARLDQERWTHAATVWDPRPGGRSRGQPRLRWTQEFKRVVGAHWTTTARDREKWKETMNALKLQCKDTSCRESEQEFNIGQTHGD